MIKIKPVAVGYPSQEANAISIRVMPFQTTAISCNTYYELKNISVVIDEEEKENEIVKTLADGNSPISEDEFTLWGSDNIYIENVVLKNLGLERSI